LKTLTPAIVLYFSALSHDQPENIEIAEELYQVEIKPERSESGAGSILTFKLNFVSN